METNETDITTDLARSNDRKLNTELGRITGIDHPTVEDLRQHNERKLVDHLRPDPSGSAAG